MNRYPISCASLAISTFLLTGCSPSVQPPHDVPRPVKVEVIDARDSHASDTFVGSFRAHDRAQLSFESPGRIASVAVDIGGHVRAGQILASLDLEPLRWRLQKAEADKAAAVAGLADRNMQLTQQESLAKEHIISATTLLSTRTQQEVAKTELDAADSALALARRDLEMATIKAPFNGVIVSRAVQPHTDIAAGQVALEVEAPQTLEVVAALPDGIASRLAPGQAATASMSTSAGSHSFEIKVDKLSTRNDSGSLVQTVFRLPANVPGARSGGVVSVEIPNQGIRPISIPIGALLPGGKRGEGSVFVLDSLGDRVHQRPIRIADAVLPGGRLEVTSGVSRGDAVVVAGPAFLRDGQAVAIYSPQTALQEAQQ